ncbi:AbfB domain-containing protein [Actinoplanes awajinensis]|uniref:AbfB domain-containing protein n=1 Tax=Actinoplanes awajinensis TaxID=135946 RepID=UPI0018DE3129|nr:AbfB domain-containing protein [Actinoplanes awajinensis]
MAAVALATLGVAAATTVILGDDAARTAPAFVAGTLPAVPPVPPPAEPVIIASAVAIRSSSSPITTGSAPSSNPVAKPSSHRQSTKPATRWPSPSKAPAVTLSAGSTVALTLADNSGQRVRHRSFIGRVDTIGASSKALDRADSSFTVRVGLGNSGCSSLESVNYPGYFLRHQNYQIKLQRNDGSDLYRRDATFCAVTIRSGDALALQSINYPKRFVVESDSRLALRETSADGALALVPVAVS